MSIKSRQYHARSSKGQVNKKRSQSKKTRKFNKSKTCKSTLKRIRSLSVKSRQSCAKLTKRQKYEKS